MIHIWAARRGKQPHFWLEALLLLEMISFHKLNALIIWGEIAVKSSNLEQKEETQKGKAVTAAPTINKPPSVRVLTKRRDVAWLDSDRKKCRVSNVVWLCKQQLCSERCSRVLNERIHEQRCSWDFTALQSCIEMLIFLNKNHEVVLT